MQGEVILDNNYVLDTQIKAYISNSQNNYQQSIKALGNVNIGKGNTVNNMLGVNTPQYQQMVYNRANVLNHDIGSYRNGQPFPKPPSVSMYSQNSDIQCKQPENQYLTHLNTGSNVMSNLQTLTHRYIENNPIMDNNNYRFVGWSTSTAIGSNYFEFFSDQTVDLISKEVSKLTMGVDCKGRKIIVPNDKILHIMSEVFHTNSPVIGDIYTVYNIPQMGPRNDVQQMINRTIQIIVNDIEVNLGFEQNNAKLNIWDTVLGDFNSQQLQSVPQGFAKTKKRRPQPFFMWSNY